MWDIINLILWVVCAAGVAIIGVLMIFAVFENIEKSFGWMVTNLWWYWVPIVMLFCFACYITWSI